MSRLALFVLLSATAALSVGPPIPRSTLLFSVKARRTSVPAVSGDGRRLYYWQDPAELYLFDRGTRRFSRILASTAGAGQTPALSRAGDRLAFERSGEGGGDAHVWVLALDPATGLANGEPRRASTLPSRASTFSPDGQWIAFSSPTSRTTTNLIVMPANGGPERVVAETQGDVWPIEWSHPDSIYFGLSFSEKQNAAKSGVYRVSASGGKPQLVLHTVAWGNYPGLSPDGRLIVSYDSTWETVVVSAASGRRLQGYMAGGEATPEVWSTSGKAVGSRARVMRILRVADLGTGAIRDISDSAELVNPIWSPDGHRVATASGTPAKILIFDRTAGTRQSIPIEARPAFAIGAPLSWSPDGRLISYVDYRGGIYVVDPATSKVRLISPLRSRGVLPRWRSDSRALIYGDEEFSEMDSIRKIEIHEATTDGHDRLLHSFATRCGGVKDCGKIIDDSLMSTWTWSTGEYLVTNFRERGTPRIVYKRDGFQAPQVPPVPSFSSNGRWMAVRHQSSTDQSWSIELMHTDGSARRSVPVSFPVTSGAVNPWIAGDGAELIVASGGCPPNLSQICADTLTYYRVNVASGKSTVAASLPHAERPANGMIANDGHMLAYVQSVDWRVDFYEFDFSELLKTAQR